MKLGIPAHSGDSFTLLAGSSVIPQELAGKLVKMTGFRNTAVHQYQQVNIDMVISIINRDTNDLVRFTEILLQENL